MPTSAIPGYAGRLYVSIDGGGSFPEIGEMQDIKMREEVEMMEVTSHASGGAKEFIPGNSEWGIDIGTLYISANPGQDNLWTALDGKTKVQVRADLEGTAVGKERWAGSAFIKMEEFSGPTGAPAGVSCQIQGTGPLSKSTQ